jgi:acetyltransferase-like isoleucine patch superfamily enzyme
VIEDYAFLGRRSTVLQGCRIGRGAVLGAGSVLTKSIPAFEVWAGNPARKIGERKNRDLRYNCRYFRLFH